MNDSHNSGKMPDQPPRRSRFNFNRQPAPPPPPPPPRAGSASRRGNNINPVSPSQPHLTGRSKAPHTAKTGPLIFNVASLLRDPEGAHRDYDYQQDYLLLSAAPDDEGGPLEATNIEGTVRFTKIRNMIMASGSGEADVELECVRCLNPFQYHVEFEIEEMFRPSIDIQSGLPATYDDPDEEDDLRIDSNHLLNLGEAARQQMLVSLPIKPVHSEDCPGLYEVLEQVNQRTTLPVQPPAEDEQATPVDKRWASLSALLKPEDDPDDKR